MKKFATLNNFSFLVIFCAPLYLLRVNVFGMPTNIFELLALLFIVLVIIQEKKHFVEKLCTLPRIFILGCALIIAGILFSIFSNNNVFSGLGIFKSWFLIPMFFSFALYTTLKSKSDVEKIFLSLYLSSALIASISLGYKLLGIVTYDNRLSSFYLSPNHLAMYLAPGAIFGIYFLTKSFLQKKYSRENVLHFILFFIIILSLYYTYSYGAWLAIMLSLSISIFTLLPTRKLFLIVTLFLFSITALLFFSQFGTEKFSDLINFSSRSSFASRQTIWQASLIMIKEHPIIGIGPGDFQTEYLALQPKFKPYLEWAVPQPHNVFLAFWLQTGLLGLFGFLFLLSFTFFMLWKIFKNKKNTALAVPLLGFFIYTLLHGLIDTTYWKNDLSFLFWVCIFLVLFLYTLSKEYSNLNSKV